MNRSVDLKDFCRFLNDVFSECDECVVSLFREDCKSKTDKIETDFQCITDTAFKKMKAYNLDKIKDSKTVVEFRKEYEKSTEIKTPKSADILIIFEGLILLVEFKNPFNDKFRNVFSEIKKNKEFTFSYIEKRIDEIINNSSFICKYIETVEDSLILLKTLISKSGIRCIKIEDYLTFIFLIDISEEALNVYWVRRFLRFGQHKTKTSEDKSYNLKIRMNFEKAINIARQQIIKTLNLELERRNFKFSTYVKTCSDFKIFIKHMEREDYKILCPL